MFDSGKSVQLNPPSKIKAFFCKQNIEKEESTINNSSNFTLKDNLSQFRRKVHPKIQSNIWEFVMNRNHNSSDKFMVVLKRLLIPHTLAIIYSLMVILIQKYINAICYLDPVCQCQNNPLIKLYTLIKSIITYYFLLYLLTFYCYFIRADLYRDKRVKVFFLIIAIVVISVPYLCLDGNASKSPDIEIYFIAFCLSPFFHLLALRKMHWKFREFLKKSLPGTFILFTMFIQYLASNLWLPYMKSIFLSWSMTQGLNYYMILLSISSYVYIYVFKSVLFKFGMLIKMENYPNLNPIIFTSRIFLCYTITMQISNLVSIRYDKWGELILLSQYCFFLVKFFSRFDPLIFILRILKSLSKIPIKIPQKSNYEIEIEKMLTGSMIDFILIFIPRLIILFISKRWIISHLIEFYSNCQLEIAENKAISLDFLIFIIMITLIITLVTFCLMFKLKRTHMIGKMENGNLLKQSYNIFLIHCFFELVFQDFQKDIILN